MSGSLAADVPLRPRRGFRGLALGTSLLAALLALVPLVAAAAPYAPHADGTYEWTNGMVLCQFAATSPSVVVSARNLTGTGMTISNLTVSEVDPAGATVATASPAGLGWNVSNLSWPDAYALGYSVVAPISGPTATPLGSVDLQVEFLLPTVAALPLGPFDTVQVVFSVGNWSWQAAADHLVLTFVASASFPSAEHLAATDSAGWLVASVANDSGSELDRLGANATAQATSASHASSTIGASPSLGDLSARTAGISVSFSSAAGSFASLQYVARVGIVLPATVAGIPIADLAAVGIAAVLVSVAVAMTTRRLRGRPSRLIYVDEEGRP